MKKIRNITIAVVGSVALFFVVAAILPSHYRVERKVDVSVSPADASRYVADFSRRNEWSSTYEQEPDAAYVVNGNAGAIGSSFAWSGRKIGDGKEVLMELKPGVEVKIERQMKKPLPETTVHRFLFEKLGDKSTRVTWRLEGPLKYPMQRIFGVSVDSKVTQDFERGLQKIKLGAESVPSAPEAKTTVN